MTCGELVALLMRFPADLNVFMATDSEGNDYGVVAEVARFNGRLEVDPEHPWVVESWVDDDENEVPIGEWPVVIWPMN